MRLLSRNYIRYGLLAGIVHLILFVAVLYNYYNVQNPIQPPYEWPDPLNYPHKMVIHPLPTYHIEGYIPTTWLITLYVLIVALVWYFGIKSKRSQQKGRITYRQALVEGVKINAVFAIAGPSLAFLYIIIFLSHPREMMEYERQIYSPYLNIFMSICIMALGLLVSALTSAFLHSRTKR